eukprot:SAG11_NODE_38290_length_253_cov_0.610390_1_plen_48_part_01
MQTDRARSAVPPEVLTLPGITVVIVHTCMYPQYYGCYCSYMYARLLVH